MSFDQWKARQRLAQRVREYRAALARQVWWDSLEVVVQVSSVMGVLWAARAAAREQVDAALAAVLRAAAQVSDPAFDVSAALDERAWRAAFDVDGPVAAAESRAGQERPG